MAWVGGRVLLCTSLQYSVLDPGTGACTPLFSLPADAPSPTLILPMPAAELAILLMVSHHDMPRAVKLVHVLLYLCQSCNAQTSVPTPSLDALKL